MKKSLFYLMIAVPFLLSSGFTTLTHAQDIKSASITIEDTSYDFTKKRYSIKGTAKVVQTSAGTQIVFDDAFKTRGGPDLKVYLSKKSLSELQNETVIDNSLKLSVLRSKKGAQTYTIPDNITLSDYKSVLIHCEAFEVLWGGFDL